MEERKKPLLNKQGYGVLSIKIHNSLAVDMFCNSVFFRFSKSNAIDNPYMYHMILW